MKNEITSALCAIEKQLAQTKARLDAFEKKTVLDDSVRHTKNLLHEHRQLSDRLAEKERQLIEILVRLAIILDERRYQVPYRFTCLTIESVDCFIAEQERWGSGKEKREFAFEELIPFLKKHNGFKTFCEEVIRRTGSEIARPSHGIRVEAPIIDDLAEKAVKLVELLTYEAVRRS